MKIEDKFYDAKSNLTSAIIDFKKICEDDGREFEDELDDVIADARRDK